MTMPEGRTLAELYEAHMVLGDRDPHEPRHGDRWETRDGRAVIVASNDWPPPAKGTARRVDELGPCEWR